MYNSHKQCEIMQKKINEKAQTDYFALFAKGVRLERTFQLKFKLKGPFVTYAKKTEGGCLNLNQS